MNPRFHRPISGDWYIALLKSSTGKNKSYAQVGVISEAVGLFLFLVYVDIVF